MRNGLKLTRATGLVTNCQLDNTIQSYTYLQNLIDTVGLTGSLKTETSHLTRV